MNTGERIRQRRTELGMSQEELAERLGYQHKSSINKIELGKQNLRQSKIIAIANALDTTPLWIMGWDEEPSYEEVFLDTIRDMNEAERTELKNYMDYIISKRK